MDNCDIIFKILSFSNITGKQFGELRLTMEVWQTPQSQKMASMIVETIRLQGNDKIRWSKVQRTGGQMGR